MSLPTIGWVLLGSGVFVTIVLAAFSVVFVPMLLFADAPSFHAEVNSAIFKWKVAVCISAGTAILGAAVVIVGYGLGVWQWWHNRPK